MLFRWPLTYERHVSWRRNAKGTPLMMGRMCGHPKMKLMKLLLIHSPSILVQMVEVVVELHVVGEHVEVQVQKELAITMQPNSKNNFLKHVHVVVVVRK